MATRIIEYSGWTRTNHMPVTPLSYIEQTPITASGTSQQSEAFSDVTNCVCIQSDEAIHVRVGKDPTATTASFKIAAGEYEFFEAGARGKVAIIAA